MEACQAHFLTLAFKTSLRRCPVPSWMVQVLYMGFICFPHKLRDPALSLSLSLSPFPSFFSLTLVHQALYVKKTTSGTHICNKSCLGTWISRLVSLNIQQHYILPRDIIWNLFSLANPVPKLSQNKCLERYTGFLARLETAISYNVIKKRPKCKNK